MRQVWRQRGRRMSRSVVLALGLAAIAVATLGQPARAAGGRAREVRVGTLPVLPAGTRPLAGIAATQPLRVTVALRPRDPAALAAYAAAVADPSSPDFRHYLSVAAFRARFAPAATTIEAVQASLRVHGLAPGPVTRNGLAIPVPSTVGRVERAFSVALARVALPGGAQQVVNTLPPALAGSVAGAVQAVIGLGTADHPRPQRAAPRRGPRVSAPHVVTGGPEPCAAASAAAPGQAAYTTDQVASAYGFSGLYRAGDQGAGQTIALYELEPNDPSDIAAYQACYGTHASVAYIGVDNGAGTGAGSGEAALDIEQVIGLAPKARVLVYQGPNSNLDSPGSGPYDTTAAIVNQDLATVASTSWGQCEPTEGSTDAAAEGTLFAEAAIQGQTFVSASGDQGAEDCDVPGSVPDLAAAVDDPSSQPFVTGVGGTSLAGLGPPPAESAWNNGGAVTGLLGSAAAPGAGGGGISSLWPMPAYQRAAAPALGVVGADSSPAPCHATAGDCRQVPDVAASADPQHGYLIYYSGGAGGASGWQGTGGTSAGAPLWAALFALADAQSSCAGASLGFVNPALYRLAGASQASYFNDVTAGDNDYTGTNGGRFAARPGYDEATGLGSPKAAALAAALCRAGLRFAAPTAVESFRAVATSYQLAASDGPGAGLRFQATGLPAGLALDPATGRISGRPRRVGVSRVSAEALDAAGGVRTVHFDFTVAGRPTVARVRLAGVAAGVPALSLGLAAGRLGAGLRSVTISLPDGLAPGAVRHRLRVTGPGNRLLPAGIAVVRHRIVVDLRTAGRRLTIALGPGGLVAAPATSAAVRSGRRLLGRARLLVVDLAGASASLAVPVRAAS